MAEKDLRARPFDPVKFQAAADRLPPRGTLPADADEGDEELRELIELPEEDEETIVEFRKKG